MSKPIDNPGWESLSAYRFNVYPHALVVITNADVEEFRKAVGVFELAAEEGYGRLIEEILQSMGHFAVTGCNTNIEVTL
jgi:hypothetical protein